MDILLKDIGKRFNYDWIFRKVSISLQRGEKYAILGPNGSGKSTLLQIIAGSLHHSEGEISYTLEKDSLDQEQLFQHLSMAAPYVELVEAFTLRELLSFHQKFKPFRTGISLESIAKAVDLGGAINKQIRYFSSGMKQRALLAQAFFSQVPLLLLDEPCNNLDQSGIDIYHELLEKQTRDKLVIICSNNPLEYEACQTRLRITDFK